MKKSKIYLDLSELLIRKFESEATIKTYKSCGYSFIYEPHYDSIEKLSNEYLLSYLTVIKSKYSLSKYNQTLSVLKIIYNELLNQRSKLKSVKCKKVYPKLKVLPDINEVWEKINSVKNIKHKAIISTLLTTGLRVSELINIKLCDVDSNAMKILVTKSKGGNSEYVIITNSLLVLLRKYYKKYKPEVYLFEGLNGRYSKTSVTNLIKTHIGSDYSPHWMRHLIITHIVNKNIAMPKAKLFSRHKSDSSIAFYFHYDNKTLNELRDVVEDIAS